MSYNIAGKAIKNEYIVIGTILSTIGIAVAASGGEKKAAPTLPAPAIKDESIAAATGGDKDEEEFVRQFVAAAEDSN